MPVFFRFGSHSRSPKTGLIWNAAMSAFDLPEFNSISPDSSSYLIVPGKRAKSSAAPLVVFKRSSGEARLVISGGHYADAAYAMLRHLCLNETLKEAVDRPRLRSEDGATFFEWGFPEVHRNVIFVIV